MPKPAALPKPRTGRQSLDAAAKIGNMQFIQGMEPMIQSYEEKAKASFR